MDRDLAPCLSCGRRVRATATACPTCGYDVASHERWRLLLGAAGMALSLTLVLAPVGLPLVWRARRHQLAADGTVTSRKTSTATAHLSRVLAHHLGLVPPREVDGDVWRGSHRTRSDVPDAVHGQR